MTDDYDAWHLPRIGNASDDRVTYLEFIRDIVFGRRPDLEVVKARKYPEYGLIQRDQIDNLIKQAKYDTLFGPEVGKPIQRYLAFDPANLIGKQVVFHKGFNGEIVIDNLGELQSHIFQEIQDQYIGPYAVTDAQLTYEMFQDNEEDIMTTNDPNFLRREAQRMLEQAEILESLPSEDPFADNQVLTFQRLLGGNDYTYASVKAAGIWYTTGERANQRLNWAELMAFVGYKNAKTIKVVDMDKLIPLFDYIKGVQAELEADSK